MSKTTGELVRELAARFPGYRIWHTERTWWATRRALILEDGRDATVFGDSLDELAGKLERQRQAAESVFDFHSLIGEL